MQSGRERLKAWIERSKVNQREAAEILGCHPVVLSQWLSGARSPELASAVGIERVTGIAVESWLLTGVSKDADAEPADVDKRKVAGR